MAKLHAEHRHVQSVRPLVRAYALGYLSSASPRIVSVLVALARKKIGFAPASHRILQVLRRSAAFDAFPACCGILVGGSTLLQLPLLRLVHMIVRQFSGLKRMVDERIALRLARFVAALISAFISFLVLNRRPANRMDRKPNNVGLSKMEVTSKNAIDPFDDPPETPAVSLPLGTANVATLPPALAGRTMDLTLFAVIRALDVVISEIWARTPIRSTSVRSVITNITPPALFSASAATIMYAWFYMPSRLPSAYNSWISSAAGLDRRLLLVLRHARYGTFVYGKNTGLAPILESMCKDYDLPEVWGDPAKTVPVPCELVHMGCGKNCETHALSRFWQGWMFAARMYAPIQLLVLLRNARSKARLHGNTKLLITADAVTKAVLDMARSSAFLGAFIALFYYGVCLSRTRLGPKVFSPKTISPQMWDSGLCVLAGCSLCGSSVLLESAQKRLEILFFVLPRAAGVWFPRRYLRENMWKEQIAWSISTALVFATVQERPDKVRGFLGRVLNGVLVQS
ncbi:uncharacterized protein BDZ99DRAFT_488752 [Mytilinidion resinicola]|uniref:Integral membrane protein n=1 Tax=Mytilinidion resinicola TaxID=574789 RepID=A0A6A6YK44_9PEZI|nr:uncharacterized protein BDZ99DRAFT_488752 [Mytilinidion resinicola]KAF2808919.1 integral membrane protein [Mytilinidion resinicola]